MKVHIDPNNTDRIIVDVDDREFVKLTENESPLTRMAKHDPALECTWEGEIAADSIMRLILTREQAKVAVGLRSASYADFELIETLKGLL